MNGTTTETYPAASVPGKTTTTKLATGGSILETVGGLAVIGLSIAALVGVLPTELTAIAAIVLGASFVCGAGTFAAAYRRVTPAETVTAAVVRTGMTTEFLAGVAGIVLGIVAFFFSNAYALLAPALIAFGAGMLLNAGGLVGIGSMTAAGKELTPAGGNAFIGFASIILGILALSGQNSMMLIQVGFICGGLAVLLAGTYYSAFSSSSVS